ncbi:MAG: hypothetical protein MK137_03795 [Rickettsiales bacterium]|nr:hypothetical protein [Rickettsiales bacterium]
MTHSGHFLFQTNRADGFASRDQNPAVQNVRSNQDKSVQNDHQSSEKSFDKTLEEVSHSETPKTDETNQANETTELGNENETNVFEVAKELKKEVQASGLSEEETDILSQSGFINVVFALAEGRNAASIGTDLLEQTKQLISPELLSRIRSIVASPVDSSFVSTGLQQVDEVGVQSVRHVWSD